MSNRNRSFIAALTLAACIVAFSPGSASALPWLDDSVPASYVRPFFEKLSAWIVDLWGKPSAGRADQMQVEKVWTIGGTTGGSGSTGGTGGGTGAGTDPDGHL
jgi:hypothetical protein